MRDADLGGSFDRDLYLSGGNIFHRLYSEEVINSYSQNYADDNWHHVAVVVEAGVSGLWWKYVGTQGQIIGNVGSGRLLQRDLRPQTLLYAGFVTMTMGALMAFALAESQPLLRYAGVLLFSMVGGMIPGTLFSLAVRLAPGDDTISTTVGWMQQWSAAGQFAGPPLVAWVAGAVGGWQWTWAVTGACSAIGGLLALQMARALRTKGETEP